MPIYEYSCPKCGDFDQMQKITDQPLRKCPTCKAKVTKLISNPAFHLKGGGWYITDYGRKGGGAAESKSEDSSSSASEPAADGGGDTKEKKKDKKADKKGTSASAAA
jgi:putative FmdB family regulatory protein